MTTNAHQQHPFLDGAVIHLSAYCKDHYAYFRAEIAYNGKKTVMFRKSKNRDITVNQALLVGTIYALKAVHGAAGAVIHNESAYLRGAVSGTMGGSANAFLREKLGLALDRFAGPVEVVA